MKNKNNKNNKITGGRRKTGGTNKKGVELAMNTIVIAIIALVVMVVLIVLFMNSAKGPSELIKCAEGIYYDFECSDARTGPLCTKAASGCGSNQFCCPKEQS